MVYLVYKSKETGPVCKRLANVSKGTSLQSVHEDDLLEHLIGDVHILRWGSKWPGKAKNEVNTLEATLLVKDKIASRRALGALAPKTWTSKRDIALPCVIRPSKHHAGLKFFTCYTQKDVNKALLKMKVKKWYASELIDKTEEFRVFLLQGRVICVSQRFPPETSPAQVAWNLALGGKLINIKKGDWPLDVIKASIKGAEALGLNWAVMDVARDTQGKVFIFEANIAPGLRNPYTISQIAKALSSLDKGSVPLKSIDFTKEKITWRTYIHPSLKTPRS